MYLFDLVEVRNINGTFGLFAINKQENQAYPLKNVIINTSERTLEGFSLSISCHPEKYVYRGNFNTASEMKEFADRVLRLLNEATARAFQDLSAEISKARDVLIAQVANPAEVRYDAFKAAWDARNRLNQLHGQLTLVEAGLSAHIPTPSDFQVRLSDQERKQIRGLYASGLYTQGQLAYQFGVAPPTIAGIIDGALFKRG